jgi:CRP-like cAMP-binding protein
MSAFKGTRFKAGTELFKAGAPAKTLFILQQGQVDLVDQESGKVFAHLGPGESFGEQAVLAGGVRSATAIAKTDCECLELTAAGLNVILNAESPLSNFVFRALHLQLFMHNALKQVR